MAPRGEIVLAWSLALLCVCYCACAAPNLQLRASFKDIWATDTPLNRSDMALLRREAWEMFDHGFSNYMRHAFPMDNLLPRSCRGQNWQGGLAITLVDALDTLVLMDRRADMLQAVDLIRTHLDFDKDIDVHMFETSIRVLGGLVSGHVLLARDTSLVPGYDGLFLDKAVELADRLLPEFDTLSGLPALLVNLRYTLQLSKLWPVIHPPTRTQAVELADRLLPAFDTLSGLPALLVNLRYTLQLFKLWPVIHHPTHTQAVELADRLLPAFDTPSGLSALFVNLRYTLQLSKLWPVIHHPTRTQAVELADRLLPAFDTPSGLSALFVNLRYSPQLSKLWPVIHHPTRTQAVELADSLLPEFDTPSGLSALFVILRYTLQLSKLWPVIHHPTRTQSVELADRLLPAFDTPSGLSALFVNLRYTLQLSKLWPVIHHPTRTQAVELADRLLPAFDTLSGLPALLAVELADRLLPAFDTPSGLPALFVNLRTGLRLSTGPGKAQGNTNVTCTACAGTLLLEFGLLSALTDDPVYMDHAHRCARTMFDMRSKLGLVGSSVDINANIWSSREATIGPGIDSYYEYLLKAYLMFGDEEYLEMFTDL
ncbi:hypothetical protein FOA52_002384 [Chlamydomonas sp. UWO 241]|nr:hypothetical protein FOA52_002384 [Chlamydomonas sp. UWO 241]